MSGNGPAPIIIKRKKVIGGDGHHGGAWKVAYADFVTAMMAFFMLMWLLNATTENQRKGLANYFSPTVAIARTSGGGTGAFGGESLHSEDTVPELGRGGFMDLEASQAENPGSTGVESNEEAAKEQEALEELQAGLIGKGGESLINENEMEHINVRMTDEGLVIELFDLANDPLFEEDSDVPMPVLRQLTRSLSDMFLQVNNPISVSAHTRAYPLVQANNLAWEISTSRVLSYRRMLVELGTDPSRVQRISGFGQQLPVESNPMSVRNNRLEITLLRQFK